MTRAHFGNSMPTSMEGCGMNISIIAAMAENRVIGRDGGLPWDIPADRRRFRELTMGHPVIMGRRTFESIGHPLPGRRTIVLTRQSTYRAAGCRVAHSLEEALVACGNTEAFVCGGEGLYRLSLPLAERIYLTIVHRKCEGDTLFPPIPPEFIEMERQEGGEGVPCTFVLYRRNREQL